MSIANFAKLNENGIVVDIFAVDQTDVDNNGGDNSIEAENWIKKNIIKNESIIIKQFYNDKSFRTNCAEIGGYYDFNNDVFIERKPYPSWTLGNDFKWSAPTVRPTIFEDPNLVEWKYYPTWDEERKIWKSSGPNNEKLEWNSSTYNWDIVN